MLSFKSTVPSLVIFTMLTACNPPALAVNRTMYCNAVQNRTGFIRYPLGAIGAWSTASGEAADVMTRVPRIYPCVGTLTVRPPKEEWRGSVTGDPSGLKIQYQANKPCGGTTAEITTSPHVTVFRVSFPAEAQKKYLVIDASKPAVDNWARLDKWTDRTVTWIDNRTFQIVVGEPGKRSAYYMVRFSAPFVASGTFDASGTFTDGATKVTGAQLGMYGQFDVPTVTVAVAASFTSVEQAGQFLATEFTDFDSVRQQCESAWNGVLGRVEIEGPDTAKRMAYTALYTIYANIINGNDGSCYLEYYPRPRSIASSAYWQFIGGYQSCCWDNIRATYPFMMLAYPEVMTDVLNTYLARYQRDGSLDGDICLITGPFGHHNIRFSPVLVAQAYSSGVPAEYARLYAALKDNFDNDAFAPASLSAQGHLVQPASGGFACSRTLEYATGLGSMAWLAKANHDAKAAGKYERLSKIYTNLWDGTNLAFRVKNADESWGVIENGKMTWNPNPQGLFEGTTKDWMFAVPHDPYGLLSLPGQERVVERVTQYCLNDAWFNDYQLHYPFLLYYAGAPNQAQRIIRETWVPLFAQGIMYEGVKPKPPHNGWQTHYTGNSGWLLCSLLGLYPVPAPAGQFIISSPSVSRAVIRNGTKTITVRTRDYSDANTYIRSIRVDGKVYPAYMLPARRLAAGADIELEMGSDAAQGLGDLYIASSDGFLSKAELISDDRLQFIVEAGAAEATTKVYCRSRPAKVMVNGQAATGWDYDRAARTVTLLSGDTAEIEVLLR